VRRIDATKPIYHLRHVELAPNGVVEDFLFEVDITAVVRVRAADEGAARRAISTVLQAPSAAEIGLLNEANSFFTGATVTDVDFLQLGPAQIMSILSETAPQTAPPSTRPLRSRSRRAQGHPGTPPALIVAQMIEAPKLAMVTRVAAMQ
jgi:hypothetical protein